MNWWVKEISDPVNWDVDGLGIIDPRQISHIIDLCDPLRDYGFDPDIIDSAFFAFAINQEQKDGKIRLTRTREPILDTEEKLFALPDVLDEEKGPYADFLDQVTRARVKMLNDLIDFENNLTVDELEEVIRDRQNNDFIEGRAVHFFTEITSILEFVPDGFELDEDDDSDGDDDLEDIPDFEDAEDEKIEEDDTMKWDEDDESGADDEEDDDFDKDEDLDDDDDDDDDEEDEDGGDDEPKAKSRKK